MKKTILVLLVGLIAATSSKTNAQVWTPSAPPKINVPNQIWRNFRVAQIGNQIAADTARQQRLNRSKSNRGSSEALNKDAAKSRPAASSSAVFQKRFSFVLSSDSPLAQELGGTRGESPVKMRQLVSYLWRKYEISFAEENSRLGMPFNDIVSALTYFVVMSHIYENDLSSLPAANSVAVYRQLATALDSSPELSKLSGKEKQLFAELLVTMGGMPAVVLEQNRNKQEQKALGRSNLERIFGKETERLRITGNGIEFSQYVANE